MNETNFFKELNSLILTGETVNITIRKNSDIELVVSVQPLSKVKDDGAKIIQPILFTGNVSEFDEQFFTLLQKPLESSTTLLRNIQQHEKSVEKAKEESGLAKAEKEKNKKIRDKSLKELEKAQKYFDSKDYDKCKFVCNEILKEDPKFSKASQLVKECDENNTQSDMFSQASIDAPKEPVVEETQPLPKTEELRPTFDNTTIDDHSELPDVPRAEPCESIVTPTPQIDDEEEEMRLQDENQKSAIEEPKSVNQPDLSYCPQPNVISDEMEDMIRDRNDHKYNANNPY